MAGIVFDDATRGISPSYTLRFPRFRVPRTHSNALFGELDRLPGEVHPLTESWCRQRLDGFSTDNQPSVNCQGNRYLYTGFSMLQHALDMVFIARAAGNENFTEPLVSVRAIPKPRELDNAYSVVMTLIQVRPPRTIVKQISLIGSYVDGGGSILLDYHRSPEFRSGFGIGQISFFFTN